MTDSVYRKTALPVRLDLNNKNTRNQLKSSPDDGRGRLEVGSKSTASQSQKNCTDVMRTDLQEWLQKRGIEGPPPSPEQETRAMWEWMRDFHKEYNDDWFTRNMPRLHEVFKPVFVQEMRRLKKAAAAAAAAEAALAPTAQQGDLLAMEKPVATTPSPPSGDLLSLDKPQSVPARQGGDLLSLDKQVPAAIPKDTDLFSFDSSAPVTTSPGNDLLSLDRPAPAGTAAGSDLFSMERPAPATEPQLGDLLTMDAPAPLAPSNAAADVSAVSGLTGFQDLHAPSSPPALFGNEPAPAVQSGPQAPRPDGIDGLMSQFDGLFSASPGATAQPAAKQSPLDELGGFDIGLVSGSIAPASGNAQNLLDM